MKTDLEKDDQNEDLRVMVRRVRRESDERKAARRERAAAIDFESLPEMKKLEEDFERYRERVDRHIQMIISAVRF
jgi:hypothetical protein